MKLISELSDKIEEEIEDAESYIKHVSLVKAMQAMYKEN